MQQTDAILGILCSLKISGSDVLCLLLPLHRDGVRLLRFLKGKFSTLLHPSLHSGGQRNNGCKNGREGRDRCAAFPPRTCGYVWTAELSNLGAQLSVLLLKL